MISFLESKDMETLETKSIGNEEHLKLSVSETKNIRN